MRGISQVLPFGWVRISILSRSVKLLLPHHNFLAIWYLRENSDILRGEAFSSVSAGHLLAMFLFYFIFFILVVRSRMSGLYSQVQLYRKLRPKD